MFHVDISVPDYRIIGDFITDEEDHANGKFRVTITDTLEHLSVTMILTDDMMACLAAKLLTDNRVLATFEEKAIYDRFMLFKIKPFN